MRALSEREISEKLASSPLWKREGQEIVRTFTFPAFRDSIEFVAHVADQADKMDHHPDILVQYNKVTLRLSTHDANGLSERDFAFSLWADTLYPKA